MDGHSSPDLSRRDALRVLGERAAAVALGGHVATRETAGPSQRGSPRLIRGGTIVHADSQQRADVLIVDERIAQIAR